MTFRLSLRTDIAALIRVRDRYLRELPTMRKGWLETKEAHCARMQARIGETEALSRAIEKLEDMTAAIEDALRDTSIGDPIL